MKKVWLMLAMMVCVLASCSDGGSEDPVNPTPKPEEVKTEITIDSSIISNGLSFGVAGSEQSISFSVNADWTLSVASTSSGATWCKASATSGNKGTANVKFTVDENTGYDDRSVSVTIKAGSVSKTFTITQKGADALLVTTNRYEVAQEGGQIEIEVKANIDYQMEISETAKSWITEASSRALTTYKHTFDIALNEDAEKREGEITFKSGDKVETVKVYQAGGALILLSQNEYTVSDAGETISVDIKSNVEYGIQMPDVDWITDEASSRGMSSHTLKYVIDSNEDYDARSAEIIFYDKNSDLKETLKVVQAQKDAIIISEKNFSVSKEGGTIEVKVNTNVDFEVQIPSDATWVSQTDSRALSKKSVYLKVAENTGDDAREVEIVFINKESQISESVTISQAGAVKAGYENGVVTIATAGTMKKLLGDDYLNITSLKVVGPINGDDVYYLRKMLGGSNFSEADWGKLTTLDLSEATIVEGGEYYYQNLGNLYTSNNVIGDYMFFRCYNLQNIMLPNNLVSIGKYAFSECNALIKTEIPNSVISMGECTFSGCKGLTSVIIGNGVDSIEYRTFDSCLDLESITIGIGVTSIDHTAFSNCSSLSSLYISDISSWCNIDIDYAFEMFNEYKLYLKNKEVTKLIIPEGVTEIKKYVFNNCKSITEIIMSKSVNTIGESAFRGCDALTSLIIGENVTTIDNAAFSDCRSLSSINIPDNVISIGSLAFEGCIALTSATIGNGVTTIEGSAFGNCSALTSVSIGKSVKTIKSGAFAGTSISKFYSYATEPPGTPRYSEPFGKKISDAAILYVPARCGAAYKSSYWTDYFKNIIEMD